MLKIFNKINNISKSKSKSIIRFLNTNALRIDDNVDDYYDTEMLSIINEIYKKDFELFDYKMISDFC